MALAMKRTRDAVRFEWSDGEAETVVTVSPEDDQETLVRKLRRVVALAGPDPAGPDREEVGMQPLLRTGDAELLREYPDTRLPPGEAGGALQGQPPGTFGWGRMPRGAPEPDVPARLAGDWELIPPDERDG